MITYILILSGLAFSIMALLYSNADPSNPIWTILLVVSSIYTSSGLIVYAIERKR